MSTLYLLEINNNKLTEHFTVSAAKKQAEYFLFTVGVEELEPVLNPIAGSQPVHLLLLLDEGNERRPLHLHWLAGPVVHGDDEVEKVGFPQVGGRLLLKVSSAYSRGPGRK